MDPPPVPPEVTAAYAATVRRLLDLPADRGEDGEIVSRDLPFSREAVEALLGLSADLEPRLGEGGDLEGLRDWAAKLPGAVARVAGVLALAAEVDSGHSGHSGHPTPVQRDAVERAILLGRYLVPHALAAFGLMGTKKEVEDAKHLLRWILAERRERFTKRDAWRGTRGRFEKAEDLDLPLRELEARGYFRQEPEDRREGPGRKPSPTYTVNPLAYGQNGHNGQNSAAGNGRRVPATVPVESPDSREIACPHCGARSGQSHWRGRESACPRAEAPPVAQVGGGA